MAIVARFALAAVLGALVLAADATAGGFATVQLSSTPTGTTAGDTWSVDMTVLQHGRTPLDAIEPTVFISNGTDERSFPAEPTGTTGVYHADVVFPEPGTWSWRIWDGFSQYHTYAPVVIAPPGGVADDTGGTRVWIAGLAGAAALAVGAVVLLATMRRRPRPTPA